MVERAQLQGEAGAAAVAILEGSIRKKLGLKPDDLKVGLEVARLMMQRGDNAEAMKLYLTLVLCEPLDVEFQIGLANCALAISEAELALQAASAVVALAPRDPRGYFLSGKACMLMGSLAEAREDFTDAITFAKAKQDGALAAQAEVLLAVVSQDT